MRSDNSQTKRSTKLGFLLVPVHLYVDDIVAFFQLYLTADRPLLASLSFYEVKIEIVRIFTLRIHARFGYQKSNHRILIFAVAGEFALRFLKY